MNSQLGWLTAPPENAASATLKSDPDGAVVPYYANQLSCSSGHGQRFPYDYHYHPSPFATTPLKSKWNLDTPTILAVLGLPACMKVLTAFSHRGIPYHVALVQPPPKKFNAEWTDQFPVMRWADLEVSGSTSILKAMDNFAQGQKFYPSPLVEQMDEWISDIFEMFVLYFCWIDEEGFRNSLGTKVKRQVPFFLRWLLTPNMVTKEYKARIMARIAASSIAESFRTKDSAAIGLLQCLERLETILKSHRKAHPLAKPADVHFLCDTPEPSAADFALYGQLQRLVGWSGDACIAPSRPHAFTEANTPTLCSWFNYMLITYPVKFLE